MNISLRSFAAILAIEIENGFRKFWKPVHHYYDALTDEYAYWEWTTYPGFHELQNRDCWL